jgi:hypothetical protein
MNIAALNDVERDPTKAAFEREAQITHVRKHYTWPPRALEWQSWLFDLIVSQ